MGLSERENNRKKIGVVSAIAGIDPVEPIKGRPKADRETKKRISLSMLPSLYENVGKIAYVNRISISELISKCVEEYVEANANTIQEYEKIKP